MKEFYKINKEKIDEILFLTGFVVFLYLFVNYIFQYVAPFIFGYMLSLMLEPVAGILNKRLKINRDFSALLCILFFIALVFVLGNRVVVRIAREVQSLYIAMPLYIEDFSKALEAMSIKFNDIFILIPYSLQEFPGNALASLRGAFTDTFGAAIKSGSISIVSFVPGFLFNLLLTLISSFFFIKDKHLISHFFNVNTPIWISGKLTAVKKEIIYALGGYVKAQLTLMTVVAVICVVALTVIGSPYALFAGLVIAIIDALPIFGSGFVLWPWAVFSLISGEYSRAVSLLAVYGIILVTRQSLEPRILGRQIGIHPLITLMSIYIGLKVFGGFGFILGPMTVVIIKALINPKK